MSEQPVSNNGHRREPPAHPGALVALLGGLLVTLMAVLMHPGVTADRPAPLLAAGGVLAILVAALAFRLAANRSLALTALAWLALIAWGAASSPHSLDRYLSEVSLLSWVGALAVLVAFGLGTPVARFWRSGALILVLTATTLTLFDLWTTMPGVLEAIQAGQPLPRLAATFTNPDCFSAILAVALVLTAGLAGALPGPLTLPLAVCSGVLLTGLLFTGSRAGALGTLVGLTAFGLLLLLRRDHQGQRGAVLGLAPPFLVLLLLLLTQLLSPALGRWGDLLREQDHQGLAMRQEVLREGLNCVADRPLLGSGPGTFHLAFQEHRPPGIRAYVNVAHNDYMQVLVETGIPGLLLFLVGMGLPLLRAGRCALSGPFPAESAAAAGAAAAVAVYATLNFALPVPADLFWWSAVLGLCLSDSLSQHRPRGASALALAPAALMLAVCGAGVVLLGTRMTVAASDAALAESLARSLRWEQAATAAMAAAQSEPRNTEHLLRLASLEERQSRMAADPSRLQKAPVRVEVAQRLSPSVVPICLELSRLRRENGDAQGAEELLLAMRTAAPNDLRLDAKLAEVYLRRGQGVDAARALWRARSINQSVPRNLASLVAALELTKAEAGTGLLRDWVAEDRQGGLRISRETVMRLQIARDPQALERVLNVLTELDPSDACAALSLAEQALQNKQEDRARDLLGKIIRGTLGEGEQNVNCHRRAVERFVALELAQKRYSEVDLVLHEQLQARPWEGWLRVLVCDVQVARGDLSGAKDTLQQGLRRRSTDVDLLVRLGQLYESQGAPETALRYYRDALRSDPKNGQVAALVRRLEQQGRN